MCMALCAFLVAVYYIAQCYVALFYGIASWYITPRNFRYVA